jgi:hypothetical protein
MPDLTNDPQPLLERPSGFVTTSSPLPQLGERPGAAGLVPQEVAAPEADDRLDYQAPPPRRTFVVTVRYNFVGKGDPMPYELDDVDDES